MQQIQMAIKLKYIKYFENITCKKNKNINNC